MLTYFFLTWFPLYLVQARGMSILQAGFVASVPAICGFAGGVLGGVLSDALIKRGHSLTMARKIPIVGGMLLSVSMIGCNYVTADWIVVSLMALAFFGKGIGALGWAVVADTAPKEAIGLSGAIFNMFGNVAGIVTPIVIGYILSATGAFNGAPFFCRRPCPPDGVQLSGDRQGYQARRTPCAGLTTMNHSTAATHPHPIWLDSLLANAFV